MMNRHDKKIELIFKQYTTVIDFRCYLLHQAIPLQIGAILRIHSFTLVDKKNE